MNSLLLTGLIAMLVQQAFATVAKMTLPVLGPLVAADMQLDPAYIGVFATLSCGNFIRRYGALRMSQATLLVVGVGLVVMAAGTVPAMIVAAALLGLGATVATPASSHILAKHSPLRIAPVVFSIKQTGVPVGVMLTGLTLLLQPVRARFDADRVPTQELHWNDAFGTLRMVLSDPASRPLAAAGFAFIGVQAVFTTFTVTYLVEVVGQSVETAGGVFGLAMTIAIPARIIWGWVASGHVSAKMLLAGFGLSMFVAVAAMGLITSAWHMAGIVIVVLAGSATAVSWHGVLLAETARLAPEGQVGSMTGGVLAFGNLGQILLPSVFSALVVMTDSYLLAFTLSGLPAAVAGLWLLRGNRTPATS